MVFGAMFERFVEACPACVMFRAVMENFFSSVKLDALFRQSAVVQYQRELLFSTLVDLTSLVVCRVRPSVHAAYVRQRERVSVSIKAVYDKLAHVEPRTSRELVRHTASQAGRLIDRMRGGREPLLKGYATKILDGNHISQTDRRLKVHQDTTAAALPGQALVLLDPQRMVITDVFPCEDAHAQERSLLDQVLAVVQPRDLLIDDRNFCTLAFVCGIADRQACFLTRQHANLPWELLKKPRYLGACDTGRLYESTVGLRHPDTGQMVKVRRVTVKLRSPTRDGDREIHLLTNLPARTAPAAVAAELYRRRWTLEQAFNELTTHLRCEPNTLAYPKAALFAFCVAAATYNQLAALKGALRSVHGEDLLETKVSNYFLTEEIASTYSGMMIAVPPEEWEVFQHMSPAALGAQLKQWARHADLNSYPKHPRAPKTTPARRRTNSGQHVSTARLLAKSATTPPQKPKPKRKQKRKPNSDSP